MFIIKFSSIIVLCAGSCAALAQGTLGKAFDEMRGDPKKLTETAAFSSVVMQELPNIERDSEALCKALTDSNPEIRLKASAIYLTVIEVEPEHAVISQECASGLLKAASENEDRVRNNALFVLAMNPLGILPGAEDVFKTQLTAANLRSAEVAAAGLLHTGKEEDQKLVAQALQAAPDKAHQINLLYAISGSKIRSDALFRVSSGLLSNEHADVQEEAINAMVAAAPDPRALSSALERIESLPNASEASKKHAKQLLAHLAVQ